MMPVGILHNTFIASSAARKNVLSPISDKKMSAKAAKKPDLPSTDCAAHSCNGRKRT